MNAPLSTEGILIHKFPFQNSDLIVTWLTRDYGRIKTIAKGALRKGSPYQGRLDLYYQCEIQFIQKKKSEIDSLREVEITEPFLEVRREYQILQTIHYFSELIETLTESRTPLPDYYDLFWKALTYLNEKKLNPTLILRFEKKAIELSGLSFTSFSSIHRILDENGFRIPKSYSTIQQWIKKAEAEL
ncbi:MAG: DNA repair protein RecO [Verrucomicrobiota bacterium]